MSQMYPKIAKMLTISILMASLIASSFALFNYNRLALAQQVANTASTPTTTADRVPPDTQITSAIDGTGKPVQNGGTTSSSSITFTFRGIDNTGSGVSNFQCSFDNRPYSACGSQINLPGLTVGGHGFAVSAVDSAGNIDSSPATFTFTVVQAESQQPSLSQSANSGSSPDTGAANAQQKSTIAKGQKQASALSSECPTDYCYNNRDLVTILITCTNPRFDVVVRCVMLSGPTGSNFSPSEPGNPAYGLFSWPLAGPPGTYTAKFQALCVSSPPGVRCLDSDVLTVTITILPGSGTNTPRVCDPNDPNCIPPEGCPPNSVCAPETIPRPEPPCQPDVPCQFQACGSFSFGEGVVINGNGCYQIVCTATGPQCSVQACEGLGVGVSAPGGSAGGSLERCTAPPIQCPLGAENLCNALCPPSSQHQCRPPPRP